MGQALVLRRRGNMGLPLKEAEPHDGGDLDAHQDGGWFVPAPTRLVNLEGGQVTILVPPGITPLHSPPTPSRTIPPQGTFRSVGPASEPSAVCAPLVTEATVATLMAELAAFHQQLEQVRQSVRAEA